MEKADVETGHESCGRCTVDIRRQPETAYLDFGNNSRRGSELGQECYMPPEVLTVIGQEKQKKKKRRRSSARKECNRARQMSVNNSAETRAGDTVTQSPPSTNECSLKLTHRIHSENRRMGDCSNTSLSRSPALTEINEGQPPLISLPDNIYPGTFPALDKTDCSVKSRAIDVGSMMHLNKGQEKVGSDKGSKSNPKLKQSLQLLRQSSRYLESNFALQRFNNNVGKIYENNNEENSEHIAKNVSYVASRLPSKSWGETTETVAMDDEWLKWVKNQFSKVAGEDQEIDKAEFKQALGIKDAFFNDRFFDLFDTEKSGTLDMGEFTEAMTLLAKGSPQDKLRFLFRVYDVDGSGSIDPSELKTVLAHCITESGMQLSDEVLEDLTLTLFESADADNSGLISFEELCAVLEQHPGVTENLTISAANWMKQSSETNSKKKTAPLHRRIATKVINNRRSTVWIFIYVFINIGLFLTSLRYLDTNIWVVIARACGMSLNFNCSLILLVMLRYTLTWLRGTRIGRYLPIDQHTPIHRIVGYIIVILSAIHTVAHLINLVIVVMSGDTSLLYWEYLFTLRSKIGLVPGFAYISGIILLLILIVMFICALPFIRRNGHFEIFYFTHLLYVLFWIILLIHGPIFWIFFAIPGVIFLLEKIVPSVRKKLTRENFYITKVHLLPSKVTHLVISRPAGFKYRPGDYIFIKIPTIAKYEYHPFTISSAPELKDEFWLHVRGVGSWTVSLYKYFDDNNTFDSKAVTPHHTAKVGPTPNGTGQINGSVPSANELTEVVVKDQGHSNQSSPMHEQLAKWRHRTQEQVLHQQVYIMGPYGTPTREIFESEHAVLIACGIGVTPFASILQSVSHTFKAQKRGEIPPEGPMKLNKVDFIWVNREQRAFEWFISLLSQLEAEESDAEDFDRFFDMQMYMTTALSMNDMKGLGLQMALDAMHKKQNKDIVTGLKQRLQPGRPDWQSVFENISKENKGAVTVFFCGSPILAKTLKGYCEKYHFKFSKEEF